MSNNRRRSVSGGSRLPVDVASDRSDSESNDERRWGAANDVALAKYVLEFVQRESITLQAEGARMRLPWANIVPALGEHMGYPQNLQTVKNRFHFVIARRGFESVVANGLKRICRSS